MTDVPVDLYYRAIIKNDYDSIILSMETKDYNTYTGIVTSEWHAFLKMLEKGYDLSLANSRLVEFYQGSSNRKFVCNRIQDVYAANRHRIKVGVYFNPNIPINYYGNSIKQLGLLEGIRGTDEEIYLQLCEICYLTTFHHLLQPEVKDIQSPYEMDVFKELDERVIISYGVLSYSPVEYDSNEMTAYTITELTRMFNSNGNFYNDRTKEIFPDRAICKLERIARGLSRSKTLKDSTVELIQSIENVRSKCGRKTREVEKWMAQLSDKEDPIEVFNELLHVGMYMRGWDGKGDYPLQNVPVKDINDIEDKIHESLDKFSILDIKIGGKIKDLPLGVILMM